MLHEDIRGIAATLNQHKDALPESEGQTWRILHNAAANLEALADSTQQMEAHFVPAAGDLPPHDSTRVNNSLKEILQ